MNSISLLPVNLNRSHQSSSTRPCRVPIVAKILTSISEIFEVATNYIRTFYYQKHISCSQISPHKKFVDAFCEVKGVLYNCQKILLVIAMCEMLEGIKNEGQDYVVTVCQKVQVSYNNNFESQSFFAFYTLTKNLVPSCQGQVIPCPAPTLFI